MLAYGKHEREYYFLGRGPENYILYMVELVKESDENFVKERQSTMDWMNVGPEKWVPHVRSKLLGAVHYVGKLEISLPKPMTLVDFSTYPRSKDEYVRFIEIEDGWHAFEILTIEFPRKLGDRFVEYAMLPGTTFGVTFGALVKSKVDHQAYWRRWNMLKVLETLRIELRRRQSLDQVSPPQKPPKPQPKRRVFFKKASGL